MNIFFLSVNPRAAARALCDRHVVKMILEVCQLLWCAWHITGGPLPQENLETKIFKQTHTKHPMAIWVRKSRANFEWAAKHGIEMCAEYTRRYNKTHACESVLKWFAENPPLCDCRDSYSKNTVLAEIDFPSECTPPPLAITDRVHVVRIEGKVSLVLSYISYYLYDKSKKQWFKYKNSFNYFT